MTMREPDPLTVQHVEDEAAIEACFPVMQQLRPKLVDAAELVERIGTYVALGFNHLVFHAPGPDQARFLTLFGEQVAPLLRRRFG